MSKLIIFILFVCAVYVLWRLVAKHKINATFDQQRQELATLIQSTAEVDELPEKTKMIKQIIDEERQKAPIELVNEQIETINEKDEKNLILKPITDEDQRLFDAVAQLFFEQALQTKDFTQAHHIQQDLLCKMPMNTESQVGAFDCDEWSVFWNYHNQSLEYYVGRYGIFYAHVDREGIEHKAEFKDVI